MIVSVEELLAEGRAALRSGDAVGARRAFERVAAEDRSAEVIEGLARAAFLQLDVPTAVAHWEQAYAAYRQTGDHVGAVRAARTVGYMYGTVYGDWAVAGGWIARAQTLLAAAADSSERGWVALNLGMFEGDRVRKEQHYEEALEVARSRGDTDLEFVTLAYLAACTERVRLGALVTGVTYRNVAHLGKIIATLDVLSGGRAVCGLGLAWFKAEHTAYGWDFPPAGDRYALLEDALRLLPVLWGPGTFDPVWNGRLTITWLLAFAAFVWVAIVLLRERDRAWALPRGTARVSPWEADRLGHRRPPPV